MSYLTQSVLGKFEAIGRGRPDLICESESEAEFGNATVTLELDGLRLHVVNDRGVQTLEVGLIGSPDEADEHPALNRFKDGSGMPTCPLEVLAVANGWISREKLIEHYDLDGVRAATVAARETIVPPFYELSRALPLLKDEGKWSQLVAASQDPRMQMRAGAIEEMLQMRLEAALGA